ncbi:hypothetical protein Taro_056447 [Colocasia esculenta]|uniref:Uncharacterized protein n=1 Tax=Colocasia esculenta TaxID=4460 RepID=A0A843XW80_COLES|nr:hypothetical protein [Colocasia esculenta]
MVADVHNPVWSFLNVTPRYVSTLFSDRQDEFIWAPNSNGKFSVISYNIGQPEAKEYLDESSLCVHGSRALNGCKHTCRTRWTMQSNEHPT